MLTKIILWILTRIAFPLLPLWLQIFLYKVGKIGNFFFPNETILIFDLVFGGILIVDMENKILRGCLIFIYIFSVVLFIMSAYANKESNPNVNIYWIGLLFMAVMILIALLTEIIKIKKQKGIRD